MKILVGPLYLPGETSIDAQNLSNPGIGGSEYHSIVLALVLSSNFDVTIWVKAGALRIPNLRLCNEPDPDEHFDLQISFSSTANEDTPKPYPLVAISHHPFDTHILNLPSRTLVIANVGDYQLKSNASFARRAGKPQIWLPVFLREPQARYLKKSNDSELVVGHVSSLHPSKGFHDVLRAWMRYLAKGGNGRLIVLGGQSLYGLSESHPSLPVSKNYGKKLMSLMGGKVHHSVEFLGRVPGDVEALIASWHLAILNPKGFGESESVSMKDCWRESVPVIAGKRFGQRDYMRLFPELACSNPVKIANILASLEKNRSILEGLQGRAVDEYTRLYDRGLEAERLWRDLVFNVYAGHDLHNCGMTVSRPSLLLWAHIRFEGMQVKFQNLASMALLRLAKLVRSI